MSYTEGITVDVRVYTSTVCIHGHRLIHIHTCAEYLGKEASLVAAVYAVGRLSTVVPDVEEPRVSGVLEEQFQHAPVARPHRYVQARVSFLQPRVMREL